MHEAPPSDIEASGIPSSAKSGGWQDLIDWDDLDLYALAHALKDVENIRGASTVGSGNAEGPQSGTLLGLERSKSSAIQHRWGKLGKLARIRARNAALVERLSSFKEYNLRLQRLSGVKSSNYR